MSLVNFQEPTYMEANLYGVPIPTTSTTLLPSKFDFEDSRLVRNEPSSTVITADKASFLWLE